MGGRGRLVGVRLVLDVFAVVADDKAKRAVVALGDAILVDDVEDLVSGERHFPEREQPVHAPDNTFHVMVLILASVELRACFDHVFTDLIRTRGEGIQCEIVSAGVEAGSRPTTTYFDISKCGRKGCATRCLPGGGLQVGTNGEPPNACEPNGSVSAEVPTGGAGFFCSVSLSVTVCRNL